MQPRFEARKRRPRIEWAERGARLGETGPQPAPGVLAFVLKRWRRRPYALAGQLVLLLAATGCDLAAPWAVSNLLNIVSRPVHQVTGAVLAVLAITLLYVAHYTLRTAGWWVNNRLTAETMQEIGQDVLARVQRFSAAWHADTASGLTIRCVSRSMEAYNLLSNALFIGLLPSALILVGMTVSIGLRWPAVGGFVATMVLAYTALNFQLTSRWVRPANLTSNALDAALSAAVGDVIGGHAAVRSFAAEPREDLRFARLAADWRAAVVVTWDRFNYLSALQNVVLIVLQIGLLGLLTWTWAKGRASPGDVAFGVSAFLLIAGYLRSLPEALRLLRRGMDELLEAATFARTPPQIADAPSAKALDMDASEQVGRVTFDRVTFGYRGSQEPLYRDFDLEVGVGERVALVGATGAGKSTFVSLLTRQHEVQGGRILVGGQDIAEVSQASLRRAIAVVPQDPHLFHRTIGENIAYGRPDATREEIELAAERACAHAFIRRLPDGYDTLVGERGGKLSGGERQRIAIARAFLKDAPILVLDEATSSLDAETERLVSRAAEALMRGRTTVLIAHRLSTVRNADRILLLQSGRIVESGSHDVLLRRRGAYAKLFGASAGVADQ